jgi:hypothetical protein
MKWKPKVERTAWRRNGGRGGGGGGVGGGRSLARPQLRPRLSVRLGHHSNPPQEGRFIACTVSSVGMGERWGRGARKRGRRRGPLVFGLVRGGRPLPPSLPPPPPPCFPHLIRKHDARRRQDVEQGVQARLGGGGLFRHRWRFFFYLAVGRGWVRRGADGFDTRAVWEARVHRERLVGRALSKEVPGANEKKKKGRNLWGGGSLSPRARSRSSTPRPPFPNGRKHRARLCRTQKQTRSSL